MLSLRTQYHLLSSNGDGLLLRGEGAQRGACWSLRRTVGFATTVSLVAVFGLGLKTWTNAGGIDATRSPTYLAGELGLVSECPTYWANDVESPTCHILACNADRGPTECVHSPTYPYRRCQCKSGYCAQNVDSYGVCAAATRTTTTTTGVSCKNFSQEDFKKGFTFDLQPCPGIFDFVRMWVDTEGYTHLKHCKMPFDVDSVGHRGSGWQVQPKAMRAFAMKADVEKPWLVTQQAGLNPWHLAPASEFVLCMSGAWYMNSTWGESVVMPNGAWFFQDNWKENLAATGLTSDPSGNSYAKGLDNPKGVPIKAAMHNSGAVGISNQMVIQLNIPPLAFDRARVTDEELCEIFPPDKHKLYMATFDHHRKAFGTFDIEAIAQDYTEDATVIMYNMADNNKTIYSMIAGVKHFFADIVNNYKGLAGNLLPGKCTINGYCFEDTSTPTITDDGVGFLTYHLYGPTYTYMHSTDTFAMNAAGKIFHQHMIFFGCPLGGKFPGLLPPSTCAPKL